MDRIKLVISDFHIGPGPRRADGSLNQMEDFPSDRVLIEFLEYYSTGRYTDTEVELVINGDFLNIIQQEVQGVCPHEIDVETALAQTRAIIAGRARLFDALADFAAMPGKSIRYIVGNHDVQLLFAEVKKLIAERIGGAFGIEDRFYHFDDVYIEHGDLYEPVHRVEANRRFIYMDGEPKYINIPWATFFFIRFLRRAKKRRPYIDKVKPFRSYLTWAAVYDIGFYLRTMLAVGLWTLWAAFFGRVGTQRFGLRSLWMLMKQLKANPEFRWVKRHLSRRDINTVIFGHTHIPMFRPFEGGQYFNTGAWNGITNLDASRLGHHMIYTYALIEEVDGRWQTGLKVWQGMHHYYRNFIR